MKKVTIVLLIMGLIMSVLSVSAWADNIVASGYCGWDGDNLTWVLDSHGVMTISGTGEMMEFWEERPPWASYRDQIKEVRVDGSVEEVEDFAFVGCLNLRTVTLEEGVTKLGSGVFDGCSNLSSVIIPDSVTDFGEGTFLDCTSLTDFKIPEGTTCIMLNLFRSCNNLLYITIPESVTEIWIYAFEGCDKLQHILYAGTQEQWEAISVAEHNDVLDNVTVHFNASGDEVQVEKGCLYTSTECAVCKASGFAPVGGRGHSFENGRCVTCGVEDCWEYTVGQDSLTITGYSGQGGDVVIPAQIGGVPVKQIAPSIFRHATGNLYSVTIPDTVEIIDKYSLLNTGSTLEVIRFLGDAPAIDERAFAFTTADVYYPVDNPTWTPDVMQDYGGDLNWMTPGAPTNKPDPVDPKPSIPEPEDPLPTVPGPAEPETPDPVDPKPSIPEPEDPLPTVPGSAEPETPDPAPTEPASTGSSPSNPDALENENVSSGEISGTDSSPDNEEDGEPLTVVAVTLVGATVIAGGGATTLLVLKKRHKKN